MKVKPEHYEYMKQAMLPILEKGKTDERYTEKYYVVHELGKDHAKRFRWDVFYAAGLNKWLCDTIYPYANDTHVDTALRKIVTDYMVSLEK